MAEEPDLLLDYDEDENDASQVPENGQSAATGTVGSSLVPSTNSKDVKGSYVSFHSSGFRDFLLKPELLRAIGDCGFEHPSEVQHECIPQAIMGMDVLCQAKSGMGKTAVFVLSCLQQINSNTVSQDTVAIVLCHIRELAYQISKEFERFTKYIPNIKVGVFFGGMPIRRDVEAIKSENPQIVVGTPGRIWALINEGHLKVSKIRHFILDECDRMLDSLDMRQVVQNIFRKTPQSKQVMMFSATMNKDIVPVCKLFMSDPLEIIIDDESRLTLHGLRQHYIKVKESEKNRKLFNLLDELHFNQVIIFVRTVPRCMALTALLVEENFPAIAMHRNMQQEERLERYRAFKSFEKRMLVSTDLFGRGMDIERVNIVFNYDMPEGSDMYLHRVARAGRFGTKGLAITFISDEPEAQILNEVQNRFEVNITELPNLLDVATYMEEC